MAVIHVGIDLGSTGVRVAYSAHGDAPATAALSGVDWPWLLCERTSGGAVPVSFPSLKSRLGSGSVDSAGSVVVPAEVLTTALDVVRTGILREPGTSIGNTVIGVPARFYTAQRTALLAAAADAGLTGVSLISDAVATVIEQTADVRTGTYLVYGMGYSGHELGLVRAVRGTYHVLGYEGAATDSGATLDARVLGSWLTALAGHGVVPNEPLRGEVGWPRLRWLAEQVKLRLGAGESVLFPHAVPATGGGLLHVQFEQSSFNRQVRTMVAGTLDRAATLLDRAELVAEAVDLVTLVGGCTAMPAVQEVVRGLGRPVAAVSGDHIALGALRHAHQLGHRPSPAYDDEPPPSVEPLDTDAAPAVSPLTATVLTAPAHEDTPGTSTVDHARRLVDAGQPERARTLLRELVAEAKDLLDTLDTPKPDNTSTAAELMASARRSLDGGDHQRAIATAHLAWRTDLNDIDVFEAMLDLHCDAAMSAPTPASFELDERWLKCALHHDPTNARIRGLLAERNYLQGRDLLRSGSRQAARQALAAALKWVPDHPRAIALHHELSQRRNSSR